MKRIILFSLLALLLSAMGGCEKEEKSKYPPCMQEYIDTYMANNPTPPTNPASIKKYNYNGKIVYVFSFNYAIIDAKFEVIDQDCNKICEGGGVLGKNDCNFELKYIETVWKDNRKNKKL